MTVTIPYEFNRENCLYRLPCGICERTNKMCPLKNDYGSGYIRATTVTTGTGTGSVVYKHKAGGEENEID